MLNHEELETVNAVNPEYIVRDYSKRYNHVSKVVNAQ